MTFVSGHRVSTVAATNAVVPAAWWFRVARNRRKHDGAATVAGKFFERGVQARRAGSLVARFVAVVQTTLERLPARKSTDVKTFRIIWCLFRPHGTASPPTLMFPTRSQNAADLVARGWNQLRATMFGFPANDRHCVFSTPAQHRQSLLALGTFPQMTTSRAKVSAGELFSTCSVAALDGILATCPCLCLDSAFPTGAGRDDTGIQGTRFALGVRIAVTSP